MGKKRIIKAHTDKAGSSVGVENLSIQNDLTVINNITAGGIVGKVDGVAIAAGNIGETKTEAATPLSVPNGASGVISTIDNITLQPGIWLVMANGNGRALSGATNGVLYLSEVNGASTGAVLGQTQHNFAINNGAGFASIVTIKNLTVADTFYLGYQQTGASASAGTIEGSIVAVRIA